MSTSSSPVYDQYEQIRQAERERADIVAKYDKGREEGAQIDPWEDPTFEVYHSTDRHGFIHDSRLPSNRDTAEIKAKEIEAERTKKWLKMLKNWKKYYPGEKLKDFKEKLQERTPKLPKKESTGRNDFQQYKRFC